MHDISYSFNFTLVKWPETTVAAEVDKLAYRKKNSSFFQLFFKQMTLINYFIKQDQKGM